MSAVIVVCHSACTFACVLVFPALLQAGEAKDQTAWTLERAYGQVLASDESVGIASFEMRKAALEPGLALARMGPVLTMAARKSWPASTNGGAGGGGGGNSPASLTLEQPLFDLSVGAAYRRAKLATVAARHEYRALLRQVLYELTFAYYEVLRQQSAVGVSRETVALARETLDLAEKRAKAGEVTRTDALRAAAQWQESRRVLRAEEGQLDILRSRLANILNLEPVTLAGVVAPRDRPAPAATLEELVVLAMAHRDDLRAGELTVAQDVQRRKEILATYAPRAAFQFSLFSREGEDAEGGARSAPAGGRENWLAALTVQVPVLNGGQRALQLKSAAYQIEQSKLQVALLRETVRQQVQEAWVNVRVLTETMEALDAQLKAAEQGYQDLKTQYGAGAATSLDVLDSLRGLNAARTAQTAQRYSLQVALHRLDQVTGISEEERISRIVTP